MALRINRCSIVVEYKTLQSPDLILRSNYFLSILIVTLNYYGQIYICPSLMSTVRESVHIDAGICPCIAGICPCIAGICPY
jgi:hypothetical protein